MQLTTVQMAWATLVTRVVWERVYLGMWWLVEVSHERNLLDRLETTCQSAWDRILHGYEVTEVLYDATEKPLP